VLLRLLTYNVHKCTGGLDRRYAPDRIAEVIAHSAAEVVLLQEVAQNGKWYRNERQIDVLGRLLGFKHHSYFVNVAFGHRRGEYGNAILSRFPIVSTDNIDLTVAGKKARSVLHGELRLELPHGGHRTLHVFNLHLGLGGRERREQLHRFLASHPLAGLHARTPIVVAGDFNDVWGTLGRRFLLPEGFAVPRRPVRTFPAYAPVRALDALFVRGDIAVESLAASRRSPARLASDHLPLLATLRLPG
jgi:endonuclease/exonuclease/phosphatase family metal-dependent hydrolase